jgi:serine/threonine protein kinase
VVRTSAGLFATHQQGVIRRDTKSSNLLLSADGIVKIAGLGIARIADAAAASPTTTVKASTIVPSHSVPLHPVRICEPMSYGGETAY